MRFWRFRSTTRGCAALIAIAATVQGLGAQKAPPTPAAQPPAAEVPSDPLGRTTPRGTMIWFLNAARRGEDAVASQYLNARVSGAAAEALAHDLFVVLDARLPARLLKISDEPTGSLANPLQPDQEVVGTIEGSAGRVDIVLQRVQRRESAPIWLFSTATLDAVPQLHDEVVASRQNPLVPAFLRATRIGGVRLVEWLLVLVGLPAVYLMIALLNRALTPVAGRLLRRFVRPPDARFRNVLPVPARALLVALIGGWALNVLPVSLRVRQLWFNTAIVVVTGTVVWLLMLVNAEVERHIHRRIPRSNTAAGAALLHVLRRAADLLIIFAGFIFVLRHFGVDPTPALAGLGVGGLAVALAAQKTLENVIAGASLIFDQAVRVGDLLKMGEVVGTVDHIGLRSTRIRTLDRTIVSVPNGQIANVTLETISARDKFWFHPVVPLRYETTPEQLRQVVDGVRQLLEHHPLIDPESVRVRLFRLGAFSMDVEVSAYLRAGDWNAFMAIQEELLFTVTEIVNRSGTAVAIPAQTMYLANATASLPLER